jgi:thioredoxin-dependent peroxiredoxin
MALHPGSAPLVGTPRNGDEMRVGTVAPDFMLRDNHGAQWRLSDECRKGPVAMFFYPAAMTIGCTAQSCRFRDLGAEFGALGAQRVGVSASDQQLQQAFSETNELDFPLLSDTDGAVAALYGARRAFSPRPTKRATYVISRERLVVGIVTSELRMRAHADRSLEIIRDLPVPSRG